MESQLKFVTSPAYGDRLESGGSQTSEKNVEKQAFKDASAVLKNRKVAERRFLRKLDTRFLPIIFLVYLMNYMNVSILRQDHRAAQQLNLSV